MNKSFFYFLFFLVSVSVISAYNVGDIVPLSVNAQYDNGLSLSNIPVPCRLSIFNQGADVFVLRNVSMIPSGAYHSYSFVPVLDGSYTASVLCAYSGDSSVFWFDFVVGATPVSVNGSGRGINPDGGSTLVGVPLSGSIVPEHSSYIVNVQDGSVLTFPTSYYSNSQLSVAKSSSWRVLRDGNVLDSGNFVSTSVGVYSFSYDFKSLPVGDYQVAETFDGKIVLVDVSVVSRSADLSLISGLVTLDDGSFSVVKFSGLLFILIIIIASTILLFRSLRKKSANRPIAPVNNNVPRQEFRNR